MSFHASASNIRVDGGHILKATLRAADGSEVNTTFDLNDIIGNNDGRFEWGGENFSHSAENINFSIEGDECVPVLRAALKDRKGELVQDDINLAERISNENGSFSFGECNTYR
ncbi:hypothetical protein MFIFM68171_07014 [Madurella fahalii]|uniref:Cyanovirin-N domain-containing protein n=1 Tax=Madurella fahalii TaxID=1157608 RepID=A0ABQ0GGE0_9PEZI